MEVAAWQKSSYSGNGNNCVEVGSDADTIGVRDSKDTSGPVLEFSTTEWEQFTRDVRSGAYDA